jgi:hypothetical protein
MTRASVGIQFLQLFHPVLSWLQLLTHQTCPSSPFDGYLHTVHLLRCKPLGKRLLLSHAVALDTDGTSRATGGNGFAWHA